jgi:hypothetical protein
MPSASSQPNVLPILVTIHEAAKADGFSNLGERVLHAAVHAWAEGHIAAPNHSLANDPSDKPMPSPPFPSPDGNETLRTVINDAYRGFGDGMDVAAITQAAALGWAAGYDEGATCSGCALGGADHPTSRGMRSGSMEVRFHDPNSPSDIFELAEQMGISPDAALRSLKRMRADRE